MVRLRHPDKQVEAAVQYAESKGREVRISKGIRMGPFVLSPAHAGRLQDFSLVDAEEHRKPRERCASCSRSLRTPATTAKMSALKTFEFTIIAAGLDPGAEDFADRLFEAGCDDATVSFQKGACIVDFSREARSFGHALVSAIADVERAGARVLHVEPDHLVSLSDIAARAGISRAAASLYASGRRGKHFPSPVVRVTTDSPLWDWVEVCRWLFRQGRLPRDEVLRARFVRGTNARIVAGRSLRTSGLVGHVKAETFAVGVQRGRAPIGRM